MENKIIDLLKESLQDLSPKERDVIMLLFGLGGGHRLTPEEIACLYNVDIEMITNIADQALSKIKKSIPKEELKSVLDNIGEDESAPLLKENDVLEVSLSYSENENEETNYSVTYSLNGEFYTSADVTIPKDTGELYIEEWIRQDMESFPEISDYEIFDVIDEGEYQTAKIRIKALKEA